MAHTTPTVRGGVLTWYVNTHERQISVGTPAWYAWLEEVSTFAFVSETGTFTARKEPKLNGGVYWKAYRKQAGKLRHAYLGKSHDVTLERLNAVAAVLSKQGLTQGRLLSERDRSQVTQASVVPLPAEEIAAQPESAPKHNLPLQLTSFVGREKDITASTALLRHPTVRLLTLTGTAGVGKTRLALQVATDLEESFADGVFFVSLAPVRDAELVLSTVAQTLGLRAMGSQSFLDLLKTYLRDKHCLLLLDNFEQVVGAAPLLADLLEACPDLKVLVTSREVLRLRAEYLFSVPPLALPDRKRLPDDSVLADVPAVDLFIQRAQAIRPDFQLTPGNAAAIAAICIRLGGLPLAIELAAARSKSFPPQTLLTRLEQGLAILSGGARDLPARQQTLRDTLAWSYDLLSPEEQALFRRFAVFVDGCTWEAAEQVCMAAGELSGDVLEGLASLVDKSLLRQEEQGNGEPRFTMLQVLREFGLERLTSARELETTRQAHAGYYLWLSEETEPHLRGGEQARWLARLEQEHENLNAARSCLLERACVEVEGEKEPAELALRMSAALSWFWYLRGYVREERTFLERALSAREGVAALVRAKALLAAAGLAWIQDDYERVEALCEESLALFRELGDTAGMASSLYHLGLVAWARSQYARARSLLEEAEARFQQVGDTWGRGRCHTQLARVSTVQGEYSRARTLLEESLGLYRSLGDQQRLGWVFYLLAQVLFLSQGDHARASTLVEQSLVLSREMGDFWGIANALSLMGAIALLQGDEARARALCEESVATLKETGEQVGTAEALIGLARIAAGQGDLASARRLYEESLALLREIGYKDDIAACLEGLAAVVADQGKPGQVARLWGTAAALREAIGAPLPPIYRASYERAVAAARTVLGKEAFAAAWARGRAMTPEQALTAQDEVALPQQNRIQPHRTPTSPEGLTPREMDVLRLLAQGLTSAQIGERLVIGLVTVNFHVRSIYSKLGVSSRSVATRYAIEHHLV